MQRHSLILAAAIASLALTPAVAQVPKLDIEKTCHAAQPLFGPDNTATPASTPAPGDAANGGAGNLGNAAQANPYQNCMQSENAARKSSEELWSKVNAADRANCVGLSRMVYPSYVELLSCLQMYDPTTSGLGPNGESIPVRKKQPARGGGL